MNDRQPTYCRDCDHVHPDTRKRNPSQWLCMKHPRLAGAGFVAPDVWAAEEPFLYCRHVNGGLCLLFSRKREAGQTELGIDK